MSMSEMTRMLERASTDADFARGLVEAVGGRDGADALAAVAAYGAACGFSVTAEDAARLQQQMVVVADGPEGDLADDALEAVTGGTGSAAAVGPVAGFVKQW